VFFYDLEGNHKKTEHLVREIAVRSLDGHVVWSRTVTNDFRDAWTECEAIVDPTGTTPLMMLAHNGKGFDERVLAKEFAHWEITPRPHWTFADTLGRIRAWLPRPPKGHTRKYALKSLTTTLLRNGGHGTNADVATFWSAHPFTTKVSAHEAPFDCLVLRSVFLLALASHLYPNELFTRATIESVADVEHRVHAALVITTGLSSTRTLDELVYEYMHTLI
jgi:DNA polymerase III epsilon subunit-like protein